MEETSTREACLWTSQIHLKIIRSHAFYDVHDANGHLTPNNRNLVMEITTITTNVSKFNTKHPNYSFQREVVNTEVHALWTNFVLTKTDSSCSCLLWIKYGKKAEVELFQGKWYLEKDWGLNQESRSYSKDRKFRGFPWDLVEKNEELRRIKGKYRLNLKHGLSEYLIQKNESPQKA